MQKLPRWGNAAEARGADQVASVEEANCSVGRRGRDRGGEGYCLPNGDVDAGEAASVVVVAGAMVRV